MDIDGQGNSTLLPGDLIYKDFNGDDKIDGFDQRPIGYGYGSQPKSTLDSPWWPAITILIFMQIFQAQRVIPGFRTGKHRWAFQNNGNLNVIFEDRWHRADI